MNAKVDTFCNNLRDRVRTAGLRLEALKSNVENMSKQGEHTLRAKLEEARQRMQKQKEKLEQVRSNLKTRAQEKIAETKASIASWKEQHDLAKLHARADHSEKHATDAIEFAAYALDEAEEAILDAVVARMDVEEAHAASPVSH
jgi:hypothetical protein